MRIEPTNDIATWVLGVFTYLFLRVLKQVIRPTELRALGEYVRTYIKSRLSEPPRVCGRTARLMSWLFIAVCVSFAAYFLLYGLLTFALVIVKPGVGIGQKLAGLALAYGLFWVADWYRDLSHREWARLKA